MVAISLYIRMKKNSKTSFYNRIGRCKRIRIRRRSSMMTTSSVEYIQDDESGSLGWWGKMLMTSSSNLFKKMLRLFGKYRRKKNLQDFLSNIGPKGNIGLSFQCPFPLEKVGRLNKARTSRRAKHPLYSNIFHLTFTEFNTFQTQPQLCKEITNRLYSE